MLRFTATLYDANQNCVSRHTFDMPLGTTFRRAWSRARSFFGLTGVKGDYHRWVGHVHWKPRGMVTTLELNCAYLLRA